MDGWTFYWTFAKRELSQKPKFSIYDLEISDTRRQNYLGSTFSEKVRSLDIMMELRGEVECYFGGYLTRTTGKTPHGRPRMSSR